MKPRKSCHVAKPRKGSINARTRGTLIVGALFLALSAASGVFGYHKLSPRLQACMDQELAQVRSQITAEVLEVERRHYADYVRKREGSVRNMRSGDLTKMYLDRKRREIAAACKRSQGSRPVEQ